MSSIVFADTFEGAATFIRSLHSESTGLSTVLDDFRARTATDVRDPTINRNLIVEPKEDAQLLGVPVETVQTVVHELRRLQLLHLWARAKCPNADEADDAIIIETDNPDEFRDALEETCHICGATHGLLA